MAQSVTTDSGTLIIPGAYPTWKTQAANSGLSTVGIVMLVGEADAGARFDAEDSLEDVSFGSDQLAEVISKFKSGPLVDAFNAASAPSNDPNITGAPSRIVLVKTNESGKAKSALTIHGGGDLDDADGNALYLADKSYGKLGNLIYYTIDEETAEVVPTTSTFTFIPNAGTVNAELRVNGGAALALSLSANRTPAQFVSAADALSGVDAAGGAKVSTIQDSVGTVALSIVSGNAVLITYSGVFTATPTAGDTVVIPSGSVIQGAGNENIGAYVVTTATSSTINCTKLSDAGAGAPTPGTITAPEAVLAVSVSATADNDLVDYGNVTVTLTAADPLQGKGKALEVAQLTTGTDLLERCLFQLGTTTAVTWVSKTGAAKLLTSASEYRVQLNANRQRDNVTEELVAGGEVALKLGYLGTTATVTITDTALTVTVVGGSGTSQTLTLKDFPTIQDVATFLNSKTGYSCSVGTAILGQLPSAALDNVSAVDVCSSFGEKPGRLKVDGYKFQKKIAEESVLVQVQDVDNVVVAPASGLPQPVTVTTYLEGGTKGGTADSDVSAALLALEKFRGNFVVPLFSQDATDDITDDETDSASTYTVAGVHAATRTHVLKMSTQKRKRHRQAVLSFKGTFSAAQEVSANLASFRVLCTFQDVRQVDSQGSIKQFQPWMGAVNAAALQAAGFYRGIVKKFANVVGALQAAADFDDQDDTDVENALLAGMLVLRKAETGGWHWVSDQSTYGKDNDSVYNSMQAVYMSDTAALTAAQRMEQMYVGQSTADVNAALAKAGFETIMLDLLRLKVLAPSDDAKRGYKNVTVKISATTMYVSAEIKVAGLIYFIPINFLVSTVQQSA
jgi:hypothetical protein